MIQATKRLDQVFQALADPGRRAIVERLAREDCPVSDLARPLPMTLSAVLQHLAVLEESGLVQSTKVGRVRTCRLNTTGLDTLDGWLDQRRVAIERRIDRLTEYLESNEKAEPNRRKR